MIFLKAHLGQTTIEAMGTILIMILLLAGGTLLVLNAFGSVILTRWASKMSHCMAQKDNFSTCQREIKMSLAESLAFKHVFITVKKTRGIIHSEIEAHLFEKNQLVFPEKMGRIAGAYDLEPSEYKRVP